MRFSVGRVDAIALFLAASASVSNCFFSSGVAESGGGIGVSNVTEPGGRFAGGFCPATTGTRFGGVVQLSIRGKCVLLSMKNRAEKLPGPFTTSTSAVPSGAWAWPACPNESGYELKDVANIPSVNLTKSCLTTVVGLGGGPPGPRPL